MTMKLHRTNVPILTAKFQHNGNLYKIKFVKGYSIESDLPFPIYAQKLSEKRHSKWTVNIGGKSTFYYITLRELKENFFTEWNRYANSTINSGAFNGKRDDILDRAIQANILLDTILDKIENPCEEFGERTMAKMRKIATQRYLLEKR